MQVHWLAAAFKKGTLSAQEISPYIKLLLETDSEEHLQTIRRLLQDLDGQFIDKMLAAADIYDTAVLLTIIDSPTVSQAVIALMKEPPPYEDSPLLVIDRVFQAVHDRSEQLLTEAAAEVRQDPKRPAHFDDSYDRFQEIIEDEKLLSALYPKAKG